MLCDCAQEKEFEKKTAEVKKKHEDAQILLHKCNAAFKLAAQSIYSRAKELSQKNNSILSKATLRKQDLQGYKFDPLLFSYPNASSLLSPPAFQGCCHTTQEHSLKRIRCINVQFKRGYSRRSRPSPAKGMTSINFFWSSSVMKSVLFNFGISVFNWERANLFQMYVARC